MEQERPVLPFFDDQEAGTHRHDFAGGLHERVLLWQLPGLFVVDRKHVHQPNGLDQGLIGDVHPKIHGVHHNEFGPVFQPLHHLLLHLRGQVAEHQVGAVLVGFGDDGVKVAQHVQLRHQRLAAVHVVEIAPWPEKWLLVFFHLQPLHVHAMLLQHPDVRFGKVATHHRHDVDRLDEIGGRKADKGGGSPNDFVRFTERRLDSVESDGSNY